MGFQAYHVHSTVAEKSRVLSTEAKTLVMASGYNAGAQQFIQLHDAAALPANASVPVAVLTSYATDNFSFTIPVGGLQFRNGIVIAISSTAATLTLGASNDCFFTAALI